MRTVLDWRPFAYMTDELTRSNGQRLFQQTTQLMPDQDGTRVEWRIKPLMPLPRWLRTVLFKAMAEKTMRQQMARLEELIAADMAN